MSTKDSVSTKAGQLQPRSGSRTGFRESRSPKTVSRILAKFLQISAPVSPHAPIVPDRRSDCDAIEKSHDSYHRLSKHPHQSARNVESKVRRLRRYSHAIITLSTNLFMQVSRNMSLVSAILALMSGLWRPGLYRPQGLLAAKVK